MVLFQYMLVISLMLSTIIEKSMKLDEHGVSMEYKE